MAASVFDRVALAADDGYRLTTLGYDCLALKTLHRRDTLTSVGNQIGVGKESDIYLAYSNQPQSEVGTVLWLCMLLDEFQKQLVVLKLHRLGRTSFRRVKEKRDYLGKRQSCHSWLYLSRLAAGKEFACLGALHRLQFPVPRPIDHCRHAIVMQHIDGQTLCDVRQVDDVGRLYDLLTELVMRLARCLLQCHVTLFCSMLQTWRDSL